MTCPFFDDTYHCGKTPHCTCYPREDARPSLPDTLSAAQWEITELRARVAYLEEHISDLLVDLPCACGHDNPNDICLKHMPWARKVRTDALREAREICDSESADAVEHKMPQVALGALYCRRRLEALIDKETGA